MISGGGPRRGIYFFGGCQFILHPFSHFEIQDFKIPKLLACCVLIFNINIFRFKIHAGLQEDIVFNTESKFSCSRGNFISPFSGHSKRTRPMKLHSFLYIWRVYRTLQTIQSVKSAFCVNNVNKQSGVKHEQEF